jgi:hypothetical protein
MSATARASVQLTTHSYVMLQTVRVNVRLVGKETRAVKILTNVHPERFLVQKTPRVIIQTAHTNVIVYLDTLKPVAHVEVMSITIICRRNVNNNKHFKIRY